MFFTLTPQNEALHKEFHIFVKKTYPQVSLQNLNPTNSNEMMQIAILCEEFITNEFNVNHLPKPKSQIAEIKRNFVQRAVFLKYKNEKVLESWEKFYNFTTENQFIQHATNPNKNLERYTAFAIFTRKGRIKHKNHSVFHLPKKIEEKDITLQTKNNIVSSNERTHRYGFNLTDKKPQKNYIEGHLGYCLYCHKRNKDVCSKGLNEEKKGCPLKQDISESILLKKEGYTIAPLVVIMRNNPFCILTGRRICNDCEISCIFQKQEAVDIQSVETQILKDVLSLPYGLEIYNLLLHWNPLTKNTQRLQGKSVFVAGLGPAGLYASFCFAKEGASILGIDALSIEITKKIAFISQNIVLEVSPFLNENLESRTPSNLGGVMEYGITARWNKNFLDLLLGLLLRMENIKFVGSRRLGFLLNYQDIFEKYKFNHLAICIGSATPNVPFKIKGLFTKYHLSQGIMMASDFLMSLHINKHSNFLHGAINSPVFVLGCGLTAIDTACEVRALLKQNGQKPYVKIIYYKNHQNSPSYKINHLEFQKALEEGVKILENTAIEEIILENGKISHILTNTANETPQKCETNKLKCNTLIIATGTKPNTLHAQEFLTNQNTTFFGDCDPKYTGSVVKALASVRNEIETAIEKTQKNTNIATNFEEILETPKISILQVKKLIFYTDFFEIKVTHQLFFEKATLGSFFKFQIKGQNSLALTVAKKQNGKLFFYLQNTNNETQSLIDAILHKQTVHINGVNGGELAIAQDVIIIASKKNRFILRKIFSKNKIVLPSQKVLSYSEKKCLISIENEQEKEKVYQILKQSNEIVFNKMNCMLGGICGRCIKPDGTYACIKNTL